MNFVWFLIHLSKFKAYFVAMHILYYLQWLHVSIPLFIILNLQVSPISYHITIHLTIPKNPSFYMYNIFNSLCYSKLIVKSIIILLNVLINIHHTCTFVIHEFALKHVMMCTVLILQASFGLKLFIIIKLYSIIDESIPTVTGLNCESIIINY